MISSLIPVFGNEIDWSGFLPLQIGEKGAHKGHSYKGFRLVGAGGLGYERRLVYTSLLPCYCREECRKKYLSPD